MAPVSTTRLPALRTMLTPRLEALLAHVEGIDGRTDAALRAAPSRNRAPATWLWPAAEPAPGVSITACRVCRPKAPSTTSPRAAPG